MFTALGFILLLTMRGVYLCPKNCHCTKYKTFCKFANLNALPSGLPTTTELLKMECDHIVELNSSMLASSGLSNLTSLELNSVELQKIRPATFQSMNLLQYLTITHNNIIVLQADTFQFLNNVYFLNLSYNHIAQLNSESFSGLVNLRYLDLSLNSIDQLHADVFHDIKNSSSCSIMKTKTKLDLYKNFIHFVEFGVFQHLCTFVHFNLRSIGSLENIKDGAFLGLFMATKLTLQSISDEKLNISKGIFNDLHGLLELEISGVPIEDIANGAFENLKVLKYFDLSNNKIGKLGSGMFRGLSLLKVLILRHNQISTLNNNVFQHLESLEKLDMETCGINTIEPATFSALRQLQILNLKHNYVTILNNNTFSNLKKLRMLNLVNNIIKRIEIGAFPESWYLRIFSHNVSHLIEDIAYHNLNYEITTQNINFEIKARLGNIQLDGFVKSLQGSQVLKSLYLDIVATSSNLYQQLSDILQNMHNETQLNLKLIALNSTEILASLSTFHFSKLEIIESNLLVFQTNSSLYLSQVESLTIQTCHTLIIQKNAFEHFKSLKSIKIEYNEFVKIVFGSFSGLHNLKHLHVHQNVIDSLEIGSFQSLHNLEILHINRNNLRFLNPGTFQGLHNINKIYLGFNNLKNIDAGVFGSVCEKEFKLSCKNASATSPHCNANNALKTLQYLDLSMNDIAYIHPHAFISCTSLHTLDVSENTLLTLDHTFLFTPALTRLIMYHCNISNIPNNTFECSPILSCIILSVNNATLTNTPLLSLKELKYITISFPRDYVYDCTLYKFWYWLQKHHIDLRVRDKNKLLTLTCNNTLQYNEQVWNNSFTNDFLFFQQYIEPIILVIILISGLASNGFLLFISFRHSNMRTKQNTSIIHLAIVDLLSLVLNLSLSYWDVVHVTWELGETMCKIFILAKDIMMCASVLSIINLSLERFLIAQTFSSLRNICDVSGNVPTTWFLSMTWISSILVSLPSYFSATVDRRCLYCPPHNEDYIKRVWTFQFIIYCLIPSVSITFLNLKTYNFMKKSISKIPGELKNAYITQNRKLIANMILVLAILFYICYMPNFMLRVLVAWSLFDIENVFLISFLSFCLFFCNTICNPISIFIMSNKFKSHVIRYLPFLENQQNIKPNINTNITLTATHSKHPQTGKMMRLQEYLINLYNRITPVPVSTTEIELQRCQYSCIQSQTEHLTGESNRHKTSEHETEIQIKEGNTQPSIAVSESEDYIRNAQAARMERLAKLQERFTGKVNKSQL